MKQSNLEPMSIDELWILHEEIRAILSTKLEAEKHELERRLGQINGRIEHKQKERRPYPQGHQKYLHPERPSETWSGRGKQPCWVHAQLRTGKKINDLMIYRAH